MSDSAPTASSAERAATRAQAAQELVARSGRALVSEVRGSSMQPTLTSGARIRIEATEPSEIAVGDVLAFRAGDVLMAHRVVACVRDRHGCQAWIPRGDALTLSDRPVALDLVVGVVTGVLTDGAWEPVRPAPDSRRIVARAFTLAAVWLARVDLGLSAAWSEGCVWLANRTVRRM